MVYQAIKDFDTIIEDYFAMTFTDYYGIGAHGLVLGTDSNRWAIKITDEPLEAATNQLIYQKGLDKELEALVVIDEIVELPREISKIYTESLWPPSSPYKERLFAIKREDIIPRTHYLQEHDPDKKDKEFYIQNEVFSLGLLMINPHPSPEELRRYNEELNELLLSLSQHRQTKPLVEAFEKVKKETGIVLVDLHSGNFGYRIYDWPQYDKHPNKTVWVLFDIMTDKEWIKKQPEIDKMKLEVFLANIPLMKG